MRLHLGLLSYKISIVKHLHFPMGLTNNFYTILITNTIQQKWYKWIYIYWQFALECICPHLSLSWHQFEFLVSVCESHHRLKGQGRRLPRISEQPSYCFRLTCGEYIHSFKNNNRYKIIYKDSTSSREQRKWISIPEEQHFHCLCNACISENNP